MIVEADITVVGSGTVGAAIAYGLAVRGVKVALVDGADNDSRAALANFGLIWLQGKGLRMPEYHSLSRESVNRWPEFHSRLTDMTGLSLDYRHQGGLNLYFDEALLEKRENDLRELSRLSGANLHDWEMLDRKAVQDLMPKAALGKEVVGASLGRLDGDVNPLKLLSALLSGIRRESGKVIPNMPVREIGYSKGKFQILAKAATFRSDRIVIAAGLGSQDLASQVGLDIPLQPQRGQIQVTERIDPILPLPIGSLRQTAEGTVMIGATNEDVGFDSSTTGEAAAKLSRGALRAVPQLSDVKLLRQWAGLRVMTPDSYPIYAQSKAYPGAFVAVCHSGITLAALHADILAPAILAGRMPSALTPFSPDRFDV